MEEEKVEEEKVEDKLDVNIMKEDKEKEKMLNIQKIQEEILKKQKELEN